jgi:rubrerythrin
MIESLKVGIEFAIKQEENAAAIYQHLVNISSNDATKKLFEELRDIEIEHKEKLLKLDHSKIEEVFTTDKQVDLKLTDYLVEPDQSGDLDFQDVLILAAKREQKSYEMYLKFSELVVEGDELHNFFISMANEELSHKVDIEKMYDERANMEN